MHKITDAERALIAEYQQAIHDLQQQLEGTLKLVLKSRGLDGTWQLRDDELVQQDPPCKT